MAKNYVEYYKREIEMLRSSAITVIKTLVKKLVTGTDESLEFNREIVFQKVDDQVSEIISSIAKNGTVSVTYMGDQTQSLKLSELPFELLLMVLEEIEERRFEIA